MKTTEWAHNVGQKPREIIQYHVKTSQRFLQKQMYVTIVNSIGKISFEFLLKLFLVTVSLSVFL